ncbi:hypothetical protein GOP47_0003110 [Adiantum capillus-veneris]|uniref:Uncharacterized protein n=1 Tax=Adiantum capillus-veneris TaxID=13818 RepID=A0A9D4VDC4_ADICA|nr:hypothetical protein GOP47_0003110 [Adiantum capillus-veneris]
MATASRSREETDAKVQKFEGFLEEKLKPDLVHVVAQRDKALEEQKVFSDLSKNIKHLEQQKLRKLKSLVNLGSEVYAQAEVLFPLFEHDELRMSHHIHSSFWGD